MSDLEKARAASLLSIIAIVLVVLSVVHRDGGFPVRESIEVCAASKGALCDDATAVPHFAHGAKAAGRLARLAEPAADSDGHRVARNAPAYLGSMTISAERLPLHRLAELEATLESARYLGGLANTQTRTAAVTKAPGADSVSQAVRF